MDGTKAILELVSWVVKLIAILDDVHALQVHYHAVMLVRVLEVVRIQMCMTAVMKVMEISNKQISVSKCFDARHIQCSYWI